MPRRKALTLDEFAREVLETYRPYYTVAGDTITMTVPLANQRFDFNSALGRDLLGHLVQYVWTQYAHERRTLMRALRQQLRQVLIAPKFILGHLAKQELMDEVATLRTRRRSRARVRTRRRANAA